MHYKPPSKNMLMKLGSLAKVEEAIKQAGQCQGKLAKKMQQAHRAIMKHHGYTKMEIELVVASGPVTLMILKMFAGYTGLMAAARQLGYQHIKLPWAGGPAQALLHQHGKELGTQRMLAAGYGDHLTTQHMILRDAKAEGYGLPAHGDQLYTQLAALAGRLTQAPVPAPAPILPGNPIPAFPCYPPPVNPAPVNPAPLPPPRGTQRRRSAPTARAMPLSSMSRGVPIVPC